MRIIAAAFAVFLSIGPAHAAPSCQVAKVTDGDTLHLTCGGQDRRVRLLGFDTPEIFHPRCPAEKAMGEAAKRAMAALVASGPVTGVTFRGHDIYGRDLAWVQIGGQDVTAAMLASGLAVVYVPHHRMDWCAMF